MKVDMVYMGELCAFGSLVILNLKHYCMYALLCDPKKAAVV